MKIANYTQSELRLNISQIPYKLAFFQDCEDSESCLKLEQLIISADCQVLEAILNFLRQDLGSYMKGGWALRKAWKIYHKTYSQIRAIYINKVGLGTNGIGWYFNKKKPHQKV